MKKMAQSEMSDIKKTDGSFIRTLIPFACFITVITQTPQIVSMGLSSAISSGIWILVFLYLVASQKNIFLPKELCGIVTTTALVLLYRVVMPIFSESHNYATIAREMAICMFIMLIGALCGRIADRKTIYKILDFYVIGAFVATLGVYFNYIRGADISEVTYVYGSKNSISQIILAATLYIVVNKLTSGKLIYNCLFGLLVIFNIYMLINLKSRASIIMLPIAAVILMSKSNTNKKLKNIMIFVVLVTVLVLMLNPRFYNTLIDNVILAGNEEGNLNSVTSGRFEQWGSFWEDFSEKPFFGNGRLHRESLLLTSYLEYGILFGTLIILVAIYPVYWSFKYIPKNDSLFVTMLLISVGYVINGIFEKLAPFGPGVKCFVLWLLIGILTTFFGKNEELK